MELPLTQQIKSPLGLTSSPSIFCVSLVASRACFIIFHHFFYFRKKVDGCWWWRKIITAMATGNTQHHIKIYEHFSCFLFVNFRAKEFWWWNKFLAPCKWFQLFRGIRGEATMMLVMSANSRQNLISHQNLWDIVKRKWRWWCENIIKILIACYVGARYDTRKEVKKHCVKYTKVIELGMLITWSDVVWVGIDVFPIWISREWWKIFTSSSPSIHLHCVWHEPTAIDGALTSKSCCAY